MHPSQIQFIPYLIIMDARCILFSSKFGRWHTTLIRNVGYGGGVDGMGVWMVVETKRMTAHDPPN